MSKNMKRLLMALATISMAGLVYLGSKRLTVVRLAHAQVTAIPFTLEMEVAEVSSGSPQVFVVKTVARRSDGSTAVRQRKSFGTIQNVTFMDGRALTLSDLIRARITWRVAEERVAALKLQLATPPPNCANPAQSFKGYQVILGEKVAILEHDVGQGDKRHVISLHAPRLGCEVLGYTVEYRDGPSVARLTEARPIRLTIGEPDSALFSDGAGYTELRPSAFLRLQLRRMGITGVNLETDPDAQRLDKEYVSP